MKNVDLSASGIASNASQQADVGIASNASRTKTGISDCTSAATTCDQLFMFVLTKINNHAFSPANWRFNLRGALVNVRRVIRVGSFVIVAVVVGDRGTDSHPACCLTTKRKKFGKKFGDFLSARGLFVQIRRNIWNAAWEPWIVCAGRAARLGKNINRNVNKKACRFCCFKEINNEIFIQFWECEKNVVGHTCNSIMNASSWAQRWNARGRKLVIKLLINSDYDAGQ